MEQKISSYGDGCIIVQSVGDGISVNLNQPHLALQPRHHRRGAPTKPLDVLNAFAHELPLQGRRAELASLHSWLADSRPIAVRAVIGAAGAGKSRLGLEICARAEAAGWQAGFITHAELDRFAAQQNLSVWGWRKPTLAVIDYAAAKAGILQRWLAELAEQGTPAHPLRLLLLERHAQADLGWWGDLARAGGPAASPGLARMLAEPTPMTLSGLSVGAERAALASAVIQAAAPLVGRQDQAGALEQAFARQGDDQREALPLDIAMIALLSVQDGRAPPCTDRADIAFALADHERHRLSVLAHDRHLDERILHHITALVCMSGPLDWDSLCTALTAEATAEPWPAAGPYERPLLDLLSGPQAEHVHPLQPDLIGEAFALNVLATMAPARRRQALSRWHAANPAAVQEALIRTAQDFAGHPKGAEVIEWLRAIIASLEDGLALAVFMDQMPEQTVDLRELAAEVTQKLCQQLRRDVRQNPAAVGPQADLAASLNNLANRLSALGQREAALAAAEEATALYRALASLRPEAFRPDLAMSLNTLGNAFSALGQREAALAAAEEAVTIRRALASLRPEAFRPDLALSLNNLANRLSALGQREAALAAAEEAVTIRRALALLRPEAFRPDLASSLNNLAIHLSALGQWEAALAAAEEAAALYRALALLRPEAFRPALAGSLNTLANRLSALGQREAALAVAEEGAALYRALASARPEAFRPNLALSLSVLADQVAESAGADKALPYDEEAIALLAPFFLHRPAAFVHWMAPIRQSYLERCQHLGRAPDGALLDPLMPAFAQLEHQGDEDE